MPPNALSELAMSALLLAVAFGFWQAYLHPSKNRVTRWLYTHVEGRRHPPPSAADWMLANAVICGVIGVASLVSTIVSALGN